MSNATTEFLPGDHDDVWEQITEAARTSKDRRYVAVAYLGSDGSALLPLREGDLLVVDLSEPCVKGGATNPKEIRRYMKKGVYVYSHADLHAKVFVFGPVAVVGSTNISINSRDNLEEAAIKTTVPKVVEQARDFVCSLADDEDLVTPAYLARCLKLYRTAPWTPGAHPGGPSSSSLENWSNQVMKRLGRKYRRRHGYFIDLKKYSDAIASAHLRPPKRDKTGVQGVTLNLYPGNDLTQARALYAKLDSAKLLNLRKNGWTVEADLHFGHIQPNVDPHVYSPPLGLPRYIEYWKSHRGQISQVQRPDFKTFGRRMYSQRIMPKDKLEEYEKHLKQDYKDYATLNVRPGLRLTYQWKFEKVLPDKDKFVRSLRAKIDEALKTWGDRWGELIHD